VLIVTHNIDEAVALADRILVFGANPGHIRVELKGLPPADRGAKNSAHAQLVETIYQIMTNPELDAAELVQQRSMTARGAEPKTGGSRARRYQTLPDVSIDDLTGFVQYLATVGARTTSWHSSRRPTCWGSSISRTGTSC
jgi:NitT/TauT family transport system ATP-binding protein